MDTVIIVLRSHSTGLSDRKQRDRVRRFQVDNIHDVAR